jgi:hypothetical protein
VLIDIDFVASAAGIDCSRQIPLLTRRLSLEIVAVSASSCAKPCEQPRDMDTNDILQTITQPCRLLV